MNNTYNNKYAQYLIRKWEGCRLKAYDDGTGVWTIGYGHIKGVDEGLQITKYQADFWLAVETKEYAYCVLEETTGLGLSEWELGALTSFTYNLGKAAFRDSTLLQKIKEDKENYDEITIEFMKWKNAGGEEVKGLLKRRIEEANVYTNGDKYLIPPHLIDSLTEDEEDVSAE